MNRDKLKPLAKAIYDAMETHDINWEDITDALFHAFTTLAHDYQTDEPEKPRPWPPKGMIVEVWRSALQRWVLRYSLGNGRFAYHLADVSGFAVEKWRYPPAPWNLAPEWATQWVVWSTCESGWSPGGRCIDINVVHVENRPEEVDHD